MKTYALFDNSFFTHKPWWLPVKLYNVVCQRSNPRTKEYMLDLLREKFPDAELISADNLHQTGTLVLLYPDAIGLGWGKLEKKCFKIFKEVSVLNGRRRCFNLTYMGHNKLLLRRVLEATFLPELIIAPLLLIYGVILAIKDKIEGKSNV